MTLRPQLQLFLGCLALAIFGTFPLALAPLTRLVGHPDVDVGNHAWGAWWWWVTLGRGQVPWETGLLAGPAGGVLWFIDPFLAAAGGLVVGLLGVVGAYNLVILLYVGLAAAGARALARAFGAASEAAWLAAAAVAVSPYLLSEIHNGVSEAVGVCWSTFALAAARRAMAAGDTERLRAWGVAGLWLGAAASGTWYYGFATGLTIGAWALATSGDGGWGAWRRNVAGAGLAGGVGVAVAAPVLLLLRASVADPRSLVVRGDVDAQVREFLLAHNAVDPRAFFAPLGFQSVDLAARGEAFLHSSYLGLVALALAGVALRAEPSRWRLLLGVLPAAVLSLGAYLWWGDDWVTSGSSRFMLPFSWLVAALPDGGATHAQRLAWPVVVTVAALAALGVEQVARGRRWVLGGLAALVVVDLLAATPWPLARMEPLDLRAHERIAALSREPYVPRAAADTTREAVVPRMVLDLPAELGNTMSTSRYLLYQTASRLPIPYRPDARGGTSTLYGEPWFNVLYYPSVGREETAAALWKQIVATQVVDLAAVERAGVRWVVLHRELIPASGDTRVIDANEAQLRLWFGAPEELGTHLIWDVARGSGGEARVLPP